MRVLVRVAFRGSVKDSFKASCVMKRPLRASKICWRTYVGLEVALGFCM